MYIFEAAQPALLYLVPACILSTLGTAVVKGQVGLLWGYNQEELDESEHPSPVVTEAEMLKQD